VKINKKQCAAHLNMCNSKFSTWLGYLTTVRRKNVDKIRPLLTGFCHDM